MTVSLVKASASDSDVVWSARVSTEGNRSLEALEAVSGSSEGLIRYLMKNRHGCYDEETEVLTLSGWKKWKDVDDTDLFATLNLGTDEIEYQEPLRLVKKKFSGDMVHVKNKHVDLLVTPNHKMVSKRRKKINARPWELINASDFFDASHRLRKGGGNWNGSHLGFSDDELRLLGFFIGDGNSNRGSTPTFNIRKEREIFFLESTVDGIDGATVSVLSSGARSVVGLSRKLRHLLSRCYKNKEKIIPPEILDGTSHQLLCVYEGLLNSDGYYSEGRERYFTTSDELAGQIQELALKIGRAANIRTINYTDPDRLGCSHKPVHIVSVFSDRKSQPRIGWTTTARKNEVTLVPYNGFVYCATVPNGTLYVRRSGKTCWSGNSPFEHSVFTFYIETPIFVVRELERHRISSYSEESGRYKELRPVFYVPGPDRKLVQVGKTGHYQFEDGTYTQKQFVSSDIRRISTECFTAYRRLLDLGIAKEVSRMVLPVNTYTSLYMTVNARSLMNILSLRTNHPEAAYPSKPMREIEMVAEQMEAIFAEKMPITYQAFVDIGRVSP